MVLSIRKFPGLIDMKGISLGLFPGLVVAEPRLKVVGDVLNDLLEAIPTKGHAALWYLSLRGCEDVAVLIDPVFNAEFLAVCWC